MLFAVGLWLAQDMKIGDSEVGVPELRPDSRYNRDAVLISEKFSLGVDLVITLMCAMTTILFLGGWLPPFDFAQIGRASCRERV